jgi:hypothetical protein
MVVVLMLQMTHVIHSFLEDIFVSVRKDILGKTAEVSSSWLTRHPLLAVFYNKLSWFVSELPEKDISNVVVHC